MNHEASRGEVVRVLIVEDDDGDFLLASECLRAAPDAVFALLRARSLGKASDLLRSQPPDLVLLDLTLPDSRGWDTFSALHKAAPNAPMIVLTGYDDQAVVLRALREGAQDYVLKSHMNTETLARAARYALERHKADTALREYRDHLEQLVASRSHALQESNRKLRSVNMSLSKALEELKQHERKLIQYERLSALGQMTGGIMQRFSNLLMPVIGYSEMFLEGPEFLQQRERALDMLQHIRDAALQASDTLRRLRHLYKPADEDERHPIDLNGLVLQVIEDTRRRWQGAMAGRGATIRIETDFDPVAPVRGHAAQLAEALTNVVHNALDAMADGGVLTFRTVADGEAVTLEVSDTGAGMSEDTRLRCFDPFFTTKGAPATGLGLALTRGIVASHGGDIEVASWKGEGTRITMSFPAHGTHAAAPPEPPAPPARELRILLIDDDIMVRHLLQAHLAQSRHRVDTAATAQSGIAKLSGGPIDLVITDHALPDQSGDEIALAVKQNDLATMVVMLTGFGDMIKARGALPQGVDWVLTKPVELAEIDRILGEAACRKLRESGGGSPA